jgi:MFS family permease
MSDTKELSYGFGVKVAVLMLIIVQYTMTMTTQITTNIMNYSLSLGEQFGYLYNQTDAIVYSLAFVTGLSTVFLLKKFSKKTVAIGGIIIMGFFGFLPFFTGPSGYLGVLIPRACVGLGVGIIFPFAASYAVDLFRGGKESWMLGMRSVVGACAGFFFMNASAFIANLWYPTVDNVSPFPQGAFILPLLAVICLLVVIIKLPNEGVIYSTENASAAEAKSIRPANSGLIYITIAILLVGVLLAIAYFVYNVVTNNPPISIPDPAIANPMSWAIAVVFLVFAIVFIFTMFKISGGQKSNEGIGTKVKSYTWVFILANVLIIGSANCMMANVAQVVGGPVIAGVAPPFSPEVLAIEEVAKNLTVWQEAGPPIVNIGNVMNVFTIAMLISGFIFKPIWVGVFKRHAYTVGITMCGIGLLLLYVSVCKMGSLPLALCSSFIFGLGFQTYNGAVILRIAQSNDNKHVALSTAYLMAFNGLGQTFGPVWIPGLIMIVTGAAFSDFLLFSNSWLFAGIVLCVMAVIMGIYTTREKVYRPEAAF